MGDERTGRRGAFVFVAEAVETTPAPSGRVERVTARPESTDVENVNAVKEREESKDFELQAALDEWTEPVASAPKAVVVTEVFFSEELVAQLDDWTESLESGPQAVRDAEFFFGEELVAELEEWARGEDDSSEEGIKPVVVAEMPEWLSDKLAEWTGQALIEEDTFATRVEPVPALPGPVVEVAGQDRDGDFETVVDEMVAAFARDQVAPATAEVKVVVTVPAYDPLEVGDDFYPGIAYALNREAEGLTAATPSTPSPMVAAPDREPTAAPEQRLTHALRLTREAVNAWAKLLHGPAIVTISR